MKDFFFIILKNVSSDQLPITTRLFFSNHLILPLVPHFLKFLETQSTVLALPNELDSTRDHKQICPWMFYKRIGRFTFYLHKK